MFLGQYHPDTAFQILHFLQELSGKQHHRLPTITFPYPITKVMKLPFDNFWQAIKKLLGYWYGHKS